MLFTTASRLAVLLVLGGLLALAGAARAQAPGWNAAVAGSSSQATSYSSMRAVATDAQGNVFVVGSFRGTVTFGSTTLTSLGLFDLFVAKYVPETDVWAWAVRGGGNNDDSGLGIAVSGTSIYVTGTLTNDTYNTAGALYGGTGATASTVPQRGASAQSGPDLVLAKYTDQGTAAVLNWTQVAGGFYFDQGREIVVRGTNVYVVGYLTNNVANASGVLFGGSGTTLGTTVVRGASGTVSSDLLLAKYIDNGSSATLAWTQVGGGTEYDVGYALAVSGTSVYVTGGIGNDLANSYDVVFGGNGTTAGTVPVRGTTTVASRDMLVAKYTDNGPSATLNWTQVGGGNNGFSYGLGVAVQGSSVYATGYIVNDQANTNGVVFGGNGTTPGTAVVRGATATASLDLVLAKYTDNGSSATLGWTQVGGGTGADIGYAVAVSGSQVYVGGYQTNDLTNTKGVLFGGNGTTPGTASQLGMGAYASADVLLVRYTDNGPTATLNWTQVGGGAYDDWALGLTVSGQSVYAVGTMIPVATFGSYKFTVPAGANLNLLTQTLDPTLTPLAVATATPASARLALYPNPTAHAAILTGAPPSTAVQVLDARGRVVSTATTDARGTAALPGGQAPGVYVVRVGASATRLVVE